MAPEEVLKEYQEFCLECFILDKSLSSQSMSVLLQGPPKVGKSMFCRNFVNGAIRVGRPVVYVTTDESPELLLSELESVAAGKQEGIRMVDCYSWRLGVKGDGGFLSSSTANPTDLSITLSQALEGLERPSLVFDSISSLALDAGEESALKCLRSLIPRVRLRRSVGLFTVSDGLHSPTFVNALRTVFDGIIEMRAEEGPDGIERLVRVFAAKAPNPIGNWTKFYVTDKGIRIGTPMFRGKLIVKHAAKYISGRHQDLTYDKVMQTDESQLQT